MSTTLPGGTFTMAADLTVTRVGYGAMQLAGPHVFGPPEDPDAAIAVLREAVELSVAHLRENVAGAGLRIPAAELAALDAIAA